SATVALLIEMRYDVLHYAYRIITIVELTLDARRVKAAKKASLAESADVEMADDSAGGSLQEVVKKAVADALRKSKQEKGKVRENVRLSFIDSLADDNTPLLLEVWPRRPIIKSQ